MGGGHLNSNFCCLTKWGFCINLVPLQIFQNYPRISSPSGSAKQSHNSEHHIQHPPAICLLQCTLWRHRIIVQMFSSYETPCCGNSCSTCGMQLMYTTTCYWPVYCSPFECHGQASTHNPWLTCWLALYSTSSNSCVIIFINRAPCMSLQTSHYPLNSKLVPMAHLASSTSRGKKITLSLSSAPKLYLQNISPN